MGISPDTVKFRMEGPQNKIRTITLSSYTTLGYIPRVQVNIPQRDLHIHVHCNDVHNTHTTKSA